jgi:predicted transcriptional regulator
MQEAANVARQYEELKAEMAIQKEKEQEMIKMSSLQIRTIENLLKKIRGIIQTLIKIRLGNAVL